MYRFRNEWFVGWIKKDGRVIVFASYIEHADKHYDHAGREATVEAKKKLMQIIQERN